MALIYDGTNGLTFNDGTQISSVNQVGIRNRIINGDMRIDQRNAGASGTAVGYTIDRWSFSSNLSTKGTWQQNAGSVTPPAGFTNYLGFTSNSSYTLASTDFFSFLQPIEGFNVADLGWGTANAKTVTLSLWVRSSLTGTFGGVLTNNALTRSYPYSYTISNANTWEQKSITIPGDTSGTWLTTNGNGLSIIIAFGAGTTYSTTAGAWAAGNYISTTGATSVVGTNGATFYITGVQLEKGSVATPFDFRFYGKELLLCQRYYEVINPAAWTNSVTSNYNGITCFYRTTKRAAPTVTVYSTSTHTSGKIYSQDGAADVSSRIVSSYVDNVYVGVNNVSTSSGSNMFFYLTANSEL